LVVKFAQRLRRSGVQCSGFKPGAWQYAARRCARNAKRVWHMKRRNDASDHDDYVRGV